MSSLSEFFSRPSTRTPPAHRSLSLVTRLTRDMHARWAKGERVRVEDYIASHPALLDDPDAALGLIYEELCLCEGQGEPLVLADLVERFPQWEARLKRLFDCRSLLDAGPGGPQFPECGDVLGPFQLVAELGQGKHGKVFLATEPELANRPLVLKLTSASGREHLSLARLQHTHIVPLYFVDDEPCSGLRVLGMPFFGGASLERFLTRIHDRPLAARSGNDIVEWLIDERRAIPQELDASTGGLDRLAAWSYADFVCWIGICIAEAIQYAHDKGLVHLDLKPSNVLITADGEPMLLDFHLARESIRAGQPAPLFLGGTTRYMSPEQAAVFAAISRGEGIPFDVDERSDIYSLGLLLHELLGGSGPTDSGFSESLGGIGRQTSTGLADIIGKCLSPDPAQRYPTAGSLAADLKCHLDNLPLRGVSNRSLVERWHKWRRRAPLALRNWILAAGLVGAAGTVLVLDRNRVLDGRAQTQALLAEGRQRLADGHFDLAERSLLQGLQTARATRGAGGLTNELNQELHRARGLQLVRRLHGLMDELRTLYGFEPLPRRETGQFLARCREMWAHRQELVQFSADSGTLRERNGLLNDVVELAVLWTDLRLRISKSGERDAAQAEIVAVLDEAESLAGPSAVIAFERASLRGESAGFDVDRTLASLLSQDTERSGWEAYALGLALLNHDRLPEARQCLARAVQFQPGSLWTQSYYGRCQFQLKDYSEAVRAFSACIALAPGLAGAYYNRAVVCEALEEWEHALIDYNRALALDPNFAQAALNRGMLHYRQRHGADDLTALAAARRDLERALALGADPIVADYNLALVERDQGKSADAVATLNRLLARVPDHAAARELLKAIGAGK